MKKDLLEFKNWGDVEKLREIENVPLMPRCFRSIIPLQKKKKRRVASAAPFGRSVPRFQAVQPYQEPHHHVQAAEQDSGAVKP